MSRFRPLGDGAIRHTLKRADDAAGRGDYADALEWIAVLAAIGHELPPEYEHKRVEWSEALGAARAASANAHP